MEDVQRVREAILKGESVFTSSQGELIKHHATLLGKNSKVAMGKIQQKAIEPGCLPADVVRAIEDYCKDLGHRAMLRELSGDLEKDKDKERMAQTKIMEAELDKFKIAGKRGDMAGLIQTKKALTAQLKEYLRGIEADEEGGVTSDTTGKWRKAATDLTKDVMEQLNGIGRDVGSEEEDARGPLRRALGRIAALSEAVAQAVPEPEEGGLSDLGRKLGVAKKELMALSRDLMISQPPALAAEAHELAGEAEEAIRAGQKAIKAALRGLGVASDTSEAGSLDIVPLPRRPTVGNLMAPPPFVQAAPAGMTSPEVGSDVAVLVCSLAGAQANDSGWPTFSGKYMEYPRFRKEWWAYRHTYHGHVRDELVCRSLKEKSLASSVRILVNDIEELKEAWDSLDTCFDRPEKYILEALDPITKFKGYKAFDSSAIREFYSLLRESGHDGVQEGQASTYIGSSMIRRCLVSSPSSSAISNFNLSQLSTYCTFSWNLVSCCQKNPITVKISINTESTDSFPSPPPSCSYQSFFRTLATFPNDRNDNYSSHLLPSSFLCKVFFPGIV
jgi:hypothetical protein